MWTCVGRRLLQKLASRVKAKGVAMEPASKVCYLFAYAKTFYESSCFIPGQPRSVAGRLQLMFDSAVSDHVHSRRAVGCACCACCILLGRESLDY